MTTPRHCFPGIFRIPYDLLDIEKSSGNQKFGLAGCEKMAMNEGNYSFLDAVWFGF